MSSTENKSSNDKKYTPLKLLGQGFHGNAYLVKENATNVINLFYLKLISFFYLTLYFLIQIHRL